MLGSTLIDGIVAQSAMTGLGSAPTPHDTTVAIADRDTSVFQ